MVISSADLFSGSEDISDSQVPVMWNVLVDLV